ncbi:MAG: class II fumarate hydratase [Candidatus Marinimicrobia bacterium]|nr:class II fumarate hydratase [Candidatus Neomarinimicrobiota bacterium]MCF7828866.1 class II fumarate hydratase [Candidatus Neomarinimicrobiota bacterium]MCF7880783.1 class II fumarate hydratase [Candidatus Neomarinimicrobiota bacterium]
MNQQTRTEKDSLGEVQVPAGSYYGAQTQRAKENFPISDLRFPRRFIQALGYIKQSAAEVNRDLGLVDANIADAIIQAAQQVIDGDLDDQFILDIFQTGSGTSTNMNANEVIANRAAEILGEAIGSKAVHPNDHVNMSQSSNDVIPTAMHLSTMMAIEEDLIPSLKKFQKSLEQKADEFDDVVKSGRTHLMDATPIRLGQEFGGYAQQAERAIDRLRIALDELSELAIGGTATGTGINCPVEFPGKMVDALAEKTGLELWEAENHFEAQAAKDAYVSAAGAVNTLAQSLLKIANDIRFLSSGPTSGIAEIKLPVIQPGSSIMPGKVNPVMSESVMQVAARVIGNVQTITVSGTHGNFQLNVMMPVMTHAMLESVHLLTNVLDAFRTKCLDGIEVDRERCKELVELNPSIATALNQKIGYDKASEVAKKAAAERKPVPQVVEEMGLLSKEELEEALDVRAMTDRGIPGEK